MIKRLLVICLVFFMILVLAGCWDSREVEELGIISGIAIEAAENNRVRVVFQYINTSVQSGQGSGGSQAALQKPYRNQVTEGDTFYDALKQLPNETIARRFFAHSEILIISEQFARERGITEISDYMDRDPQFRGNAFLLVGRGNDMVSLMDTAGTISSTPTHRLNNILRHQDLTSTYGLLRLADFNRVLDSGYEQPFTGLVEQHPSLSRPDAPGHGLLDGQVPEPAYDLAINGTALFKEDKMVGWLNQEESRGLLWLRGEVKQGRIKFSLPDDNEGIILTEIHQAKTRVKPYINDGEVIMDVKIDVKSVVEEVTGRTPLDMADDLERLEEAQNQAVLKEVEAALNIAQRQLQVDAFGFGEIVHRRYPRQWQEMKYNWADIFPGLQVQVEVKSTILHTNLTSHSASVRAETKD